MKKTTKMLATSLLVAVGLLRVAVIHQVLRMLQIA